MTKMRSGWKFTRVFILFLLAALFSPRPAQSAELRQETVKAFNDYIAKSESRMQSELRNGPFLYIDSLPAAQRSADYNQLRNGQILLRPEDTQDDGHAFKVPHGLIYDWSGIVFIPGASLKQTLGVILDYNDYHKIYSDVHESRLISRSGDTSKNFLQLYKKSLVTAVFDARFESHLDRIGSTRAVIHSHATRIAYVADAGTPSAHELSPGDGPGYLWRLNSYWRFEEKDGGVYVQVESIALSRSIPFLIAWLVEPLVKNIPRETLTTLLKETRTAVQHAEKKKSPATST